MNVLLVKKELNFSLVKDKKPRWSTSKSMQAFLSPVPHLYQVNGKTVPPGESLECKTKTGATYEVVNTKHYGKT